MKNQDNHKLFLKCSCSCSILVLEKEDNLLYISLFKRGYNNVLSFKERIRWCLQILKTGNIWTDSVVLENKEVKELVKFVKNKKITS